MDYIPLLTAKEIEKRNDKHVYIYIYLYMYIMYIYNIYNHHKKFVKNRYK